MKCLGRLCDQHVSSIKRKAMLAGLRMPPAHELEPLESRFPQLDLPMLQSLKACLLADPDNNVGLVRGAEGLPLLRARGGNVLRELPPEAGEGP